MKVLTWLITVLLYPIIKLWTFGFVFSKLWGWFVVPFGLPIISLYYAVGGILIYGMFSFEKGWKEYKSNEENKTHPTNIDKLHKVISRVLFYFLILGFGYLINTLIQL